METSKVHNFDNGLSLKYFTEEQFKGVLLYRDVKDSEWFRIELNMLETFVCAIINESPKWKLEKLLPKKNADTLMKLFSGLDIFFHRIELETVVMEGLTDAKSGKTTDPKSGKTPDEWGINKCVNSNYHALSYCSFVFSEKKRSVPRRSDLGIKLPNFHLAVEILKDEDYSTHVYMAHTRETLDQIILTRFGIEKFSVTSDSEASWFDVLNGGGKGVRVVKTK